LNTQLPSVSGIKNYIFFQGKEPTPPIYTQTLSMLESYINICICIADVTFYQSFLLRITDKRSCYDRRGKI